MTQNDQDAVVGRHHRELRDAREKIAKLRARARALGDGFDTIAHFCRASIENLILDGESTDTRFVQRSGNMYGRNNEQHRPSRESLILEQVVSLRDEVRQLSIRESELVDSLKQMGFKEP